MGYTLHVYNNGAHEIDIMANKGNNQYYIGIFSVHTIIPFHAGIATLSTDSPFLDELKVSVLPLLSTS